MSITSFLSRLKPIKLEKKVEVYDPFILKCSVTEMVFSPILNHHPYMLLV